MRQAKSMWMRTLISPASPETLLDTVLPALCLFSYERLSARHFSSRLCFRVLVSSDTNTLPTENSMRFNQTFCFGVAGLGDQPKISS